MTSRDVTSISQLPESFGHFELSRQREPKTVLEPRMTPGNPLEPPVTFCFRLGYRMLPGVTEIVGNPR